MTVGKDVSEELDPHAVLRALEAKARSGKPVDPVEMAGALVGVEAAKRIDALAAEGAQVRADRAAAAAAGKRLVEVKATAALDLAARKDLVEQRYRAAHDALVGLARACEQYTEGVNEHAQLFYQAGVPSGFWSTPATGSDVPDVDGVDPDNYAWFEQGMVPRYLRVGGVNHAPTNPETLLHNVFGEARTAHLRLRG